VAIAAKEWRQLVGWVAATGIDDPDEFVRRGADRTLAVLERIAPATTRALGKAEPELARKISTGSGKWVTETALHVRLLLSLGFDAQIVRGAPVGSWTSSEYSWWPVDRWLGVPIAGAPTTGATADLVARYLRSFGPASTADIRWWTGLTAGAVTTALGSIGAVQVTMRDPDAGDTVGWVMPGDLESPEPSESVALLPALDPTTMGWKERDGYLGEHGALGASLFDRNGNAGPTVWVDGQVVGAWAQRNDGSIVTELLVDVPVRRQRQIAREAERLRDLIGDARVTPRFPTPLQRSLQAD
jgi:hypothetical protein